MVERLSRLRALEGAPQQAAAAAACACLALRVVGVPLLRQRARLEGTLLLHRQLCVELAARRVEREEVAIDRRAREGRLLMVRVGVRVRVRVRVRVGVRVRVTSVRGARAGALGRGPWRTGCSRGASISAQKNSLT